MTKSWYVIQTMGGKEGYVVDLIERLPRAEELVQEMFVPRYRVKKRYQGAWQMREEILLPGYVFVITNNPKALQAVLLAIPTFARMLRSNDAFAKLDRSEISFINAFTEPNNRVVEMSEGVIEGDKIVILNGPLMSQTGLIKKIDRHKRLAYLEVEMLGRSVNIRVGLEIVRKS